MDFIIEIENLTYKYSNGHAALKNISIQVPRGAIYGFLGPNGAGKSTTMRLLSGLMYDDGNNISLFGNALNHQMPQVFSKMGCLVEQPVLYKHLNAFDHLELICKSNGLPTDKIEEVLTTVDLLSAKSLPVKRFSLGMKQRLAIALCLIKEPELLLLDEPVNGLDPTGMQEVRNLLLKLNQEKGITIFISSHLLAELEKMCTHVCIIHKGEIAYSGTMLQLREKFERVPVVIQTGPIGAAIQIEGYDVAIDVDEISIPIQSKLEIPAIIKQLVAQDIPVYRVEQKGSLESWFLEITQQ